MPHIDVPNEIPGIRALLAFRPETAEPLGALANALLHAPNSLTRGRTRADCGVRVLAECVHLLLAQSRGGCRLPPWRRNAGRCGVATRARGYLREAEGAARRGGRVQQSGRIGPPEDIARARSLGATDIEIHDTVLIAAAFCMFNRYVDGLAALTPTDPAAYRERAR